MITANAKAAENKQGTAQEPKATKKASTRTPRADVAQVKSKSGKKATPAKKAPKGKKKADKLAARQGSKTAQILELLKRPGGATLQELMATTEWQPHSVRGFISGTLGKKMGLTVESAKSEKGERSYSIKG